MKKSTFVKLWSKVERKTRDAAHVQDILIALAEGHTDDRGVRCAYRVDGTKYVIIDDTGADPARFVPIQTVLRNRLEHALGSLYEDFCMGRVDEDEFRDRQHNVFKSALSAVKEFHQVGKLKEDYVLFSLGRKLWLTTATIGFERYKEMGLFQWATE